MRHRSACALLVFMSTASCGCRGAPGHAPQPGAAAVHRREPAVVIATVDGVPIDRADVLGQMGRTGQGARAALAQLIDDQLLVAEARRSLERGDDDIAQITASAAVQLMLERDLEPRLDKGAIPDDVLRSLYDKARSVFVHPRLVEIALLSVYTGARMKDAPRARALETAKALEAYVRGRPTSTPDDFKAIADEPAWRDRRVKYARFLQALEEPLAADVGRPVSALTHAGQTTGLIVAESGDHIARYVGERPPENVTFDQAKPALRDQLAERWRQTQFLEYAQTLANPHRIEAFPERLQTPSAP